jgi:hypothetical protein
MNPTVKSFSVGFIYQLGKTFFKAEGMDERETMKILIPNRKGCHPQS